VDFVVAELSKIEFLLVVGIFIAKALLFAELGFHGIPGSEILEAPIFSKVRHIMVVIMISVVVVVSIIHHISHHVVEIIVAHAEFWEVAAEVPVWSGHAFSPAFSAHVVIVSGVSLVTLVGQCCSIDGVLSIVEGAQVVRNKLDCGC